MDGSSWEKFQELKKKLIATVLTKSNGNEKFVNYACGTGIICVLIQNDKVVSYASQELKPYECNYPPHDLKLVDAMFVLKIWRYNLYRVMCEICTDHESLKYYFTQKELNMRQKRSLEFVTDYDCDINYHSRKANVIANTLSHKHVGYYVSLIKRQVKLQEDLKSLDIKILVCEQIPNLANLKGSTHNYQEGLG